MRFHPLLAKSSDHPSAGKGGQGGPAAAPVSASAGSSWQPLVGCLFGMRVRVRSATGEEALAVRSEYIPNWLDENRDQPLGFTPVEWQRV